MKKEEIPLFRALQGETVHHVKMVIAPRHGAIRLLLVSGQALFSSDGKKMGAVVAMHDITERKYAEEKLRKVNSFLMSIRNINQTLLVSQNEADLFKNVCSSLLDLKCIKFAWIGVIEKGNFDVKPVAHAGVNEGYLSSIKVRWDDSEYGKGPIGTTIKTSQPVVITDTEDDSKLDTWKNEILKRGYNSIASLPLIFNQDVIGTLTVYSGEKEAFQEEEIEFLKEIAGDIAIGVKTLRLEKRLEQSLEDLKKTLNGTIEAISLMSEMRDPYTSGHQKRVAQLACAIAKEIGFTEDRIEGIRISGLLHDIGKIVVPAEILSKPGRLNDYEFAIIRTHAKVGYDILKGLHFPSPVAQTVLQHQERLDGSGYPGSLKEEEIILEARILAVADVVEAMSNHRPYRPALGINKALLEIEQKKGIHYDPDVVNACCKTFTENGFQFSA